MLPGKTDALLMRNLRALCERLAHVRRGRDATSVILDCEGGQSQCHFGRGVYPRPFFGFPSKIAHEAPGLYSKAFRRINRNPSGRRVTTPLLELPLPQTLRSSMSARARLAADASARSRVRNCVNAVTQCGDSFAFPPRRITPRSLCIIRLTYSTTCNYFGLRTKRHR